VILEVSVTRYRNTVYNVAKVSDNIEVFISGYWSTVFIMLLHMGDTSGSITGCWITVHSVAKVGVPEESMIYYCNSRYSVDKAGDT
jgi:hypothetical protein